MKKFISGFLFVMAMSACSYGQSSNDCNNNISVDNDRFTGEKIITGKDIITVSTGLNDKKGIKIFNSMAGKNKDVILCTVTAMGINCIDRGDKVYFLTTEGLRFNMTHTADFNCRGDYMLYFGGAYNNLRELSYLTSNKIKAIRVVSKTNVIDVYLTEEHANRLYNELRCLTQYMKRQ